MTPRRSWGSGLRLDQATTFEAVDPVGHGAAGDQGLADQLAGGELVGGAGATQCGEHVELPALELVLREGLGAVEVEAAGESRDPGEHLQRGDVEVGALAAPGLDDAVHVVGRWHDGSCSSGTHAEKSTSHQVS